jgi:hypothetical protein
MSREVAFDLHLGEASIDELLRRVQRSDATASEAAVRRFLLEMEEARAALDTLDLANAPLPVAYSPSWSADDDR